MCQWMSGKISSVVLVQSTWELSGQSGGWGRNQEFVRKLVLRAAFFILSGGGEEEGEEEEEEGSARLSPG